jgi:hypothetical protein
MRRIVEKGMRQVKQVSDFAKLEHSSKSTNVCNEYGLSNVFITDQRHTIVANARIVGSVWPKRRSKKVLVMAT